jgi:hypothetical protein
MAGHGGALEWKRTKTMPIDRTDHGASASMRPDALELADRFQMAEAAPDMLAALKAVEAWDRMGTHSLLVSSMTHVFAIVRAAIAKAEPVDPTPTIFVQFSDDGQFIRKWSFEPFEAGTRYIPAFVPHWDNPDGPQAA